MVNVGRPLAHRRRAGPGGAQGAALHSPNGHHL